MHSFPLEPRRYSYVMYVHITPHASEIMAERLGWATLSNFEIRTKVHMKRVFPIAQYYTQDNRLRKHIAYSNVKIVWETKLSILCSLTHAKLVP